MKILINAYHFGAVLSWEDWHILEAKFIKLKLELRDEPRMVFPGETGEQKTMFLKDPNGYAIEFKTFEDGDKLFKSE